MANDRSEFAPQVRDGAWWSGDSRMAANGRANEVIMTKLGMMERPDLSEVEAVQMGHVMQPIIGKLAQERLKIELKDADYSMTHKTESWLRSHFDFISADGKTLVEAKNYGSHQRNKFDPESMLVPAADLAQCVHEAAVHGVSRVVLAVLFGGSEFHTFDLQISDIQKEDLIKEMARYWGAVVGGTPLPPEDTTQAKTMWPIGTASSITAAQDMERIASALKNMSIKRKELETEEDKLKTYLQTYMSTHSELISVDGKILATWKNSKSSKTFDKNLFKSAFPDMYEQFVVDIPGSRRFLVK